MAGSEGYDADIYIEQSREVSSYEIERLQNIWEARLEEGYRFLPTEGRIADQVATNLERKYHQDIYMGRARVLCNVLDSLIYVGVYSWSQFDPGPINRG